MEISTFGQAKINAATKRQTEMVFPKRRGVEILELFPKHMVRNVKNSLIQN
jgi:hypothetical protein